MAKMKDYQIFRCPYCACEYFDRTACKGKKVGNPMMKCPDCGKESYRSSILEPALIDGKRYFDIKFSSAYGNFRIGIILIYAIFLFFILIKKNLTMSLCMVAVAVVIYAAYLVIRLIHRQTVLRSDEYRTQIAYSLKRLSDPAYAKMVTKSQGIDPGSVYYYELHEHKQ